MPPRTGPFAGGALIRKAAQRYANREERDLVEELRRLRVRQGQARFRRDFDYRPEDAQVEVPDEPVSPTEPSEPMASRDRERRISDVIAGAKPAETGEAPATEGAASDGTDSTGPGRTMADELRDLRSTGGSPLVPGDVREPEAVSRVGDQAASQAASMPNARRLERAMMPARMGEDRMGLPGGGSISMRTPQERRMKELSQNLGDAFGVEPSRAEAALTAGDADFLFGPERDEMDRSEMVDRMADVTARLWLENPNADATEIARRSNLPLQVVEQGRNRAENLQPDLFEDPSDEDRPDFLDTEVGGQFRSYMRENPDATIGEFQRETGMDVPSYYRSEAFEIMDESTQRERQAGERRRAREEDFARAFGLDEGPVNQWQSVVLRRASQHGNWSDVRRELEEQRDRYQRQVQQLPAPAQERKIASENLERAERYLRALETLQSRADREESQGLVVGSDGTIRISGG